MVFVFLLFLFAHTCGALNPTFQNACPSSSTSIEKSRSLLQEMLNQQMEVQPNFMASKQKLMDLCLPISSSTSSSFQMLLASPEPIRLVYFSSVHDGIEKENQNINDRIWRSALRFGRVDKGLGSLPLPLENIGPFTVSVWPTLPDFVITLMFSKYFSLRYLYNFENQQDKSSSVMRYLEFQCILFGKLVYNRIIDRKETWECFFIHGSEKEGEVLALVAINDDLAYQRIAAFRR